MTTILRSSSFGALALGAALLTGACGTQSADATSLPPVAADSTATSLARPKAVKGPSKPTSREVTLPAGTPLSLSLTSSLASDTSAIEDTVTAELTRAIVIDGRQVVPAGASVSGNVTSVDDAGRVTGRGHITFRFTMLRTGRNQYQMRSIPVSREANATKSADATKIGIGAGAGAAIGGILGGKKGAAQGAVVGGGAGTGIVLATKGKEIRLGPGDDVSSELTAPLTIRVQIS
jgi:hypothetical protein